MSNELLPITALVRRELISNLRQGPFFYLLLLCALAAILLASIPIRDWPSGVSEGAYLEQAHNTSRFVFTVIAYMLAIGAIAIVPAKSGSAIVSEREEDTLGLLSMTYARPWQVVAAKMVNSVGHFLLLLLALMPIAASTFFFGGLDINLFWRILAVIAAPALACSAAGVLCSCYFRRPSTAIGFSYISTMVLLGLPTLCVFVALDHLDVADFQDSIRTVGLYTVPLVAFFVNTDFSPSSAAQAGSGAIACGLLFTLIAVVLVAASNLLLARQWGRCSPIESPKPKTKIRNIKMRRSPSPSFRNSANPLYLKEIWFEMPLRRGFGWIVIVLPFGMSMLATLLIAWIRGSNESSRAFGEAFKEWQVLQAIFLPVLLIAATGNLFTREHEKSTLESLRATLLTPAAIVTAKLSASFRATGIMFLSAILGSTPLLLIPEISKHAILLGYLLLAQCLLMAWGITSLASAMHRKLPTAYVSAYVGIAMALVGNLVVATILTYVFRRYSMTPYLLDTLKVLFSPVFAFSSHVDLVGREVLVVSYGEQISGLSPLAHTAIVTSTTIASCYFVFTRMHCDKSGKSFWRLGRTLQRAFRS